MNNIPTPRNRIEAQALQEQRKALVDIMLDTTHHPAKVAGNTQCIKMIDSIDERLKEWSSKK